MTNKIGPTVYKLVYGIRINPNTLLTRATMMQWLNNALTISSSALSVVMR